MSAVQTLPRWDMTAVFPGLESPEFEKEFVSVTQSITDLARLFDDYHVGGLDHPGLDQQTADEFNAVMERYGDLQTRLMTLRSYIRAFVSTDSRDDLAQARLSELQQHTMQLTQLHSRFTAWIGSLDIEALINRSSMARDHAYMLQKLKVGAEHLMPQTEEDLAAELEVTGGTAWARLHNRITSQLMVPVELHGHVHELPMSVIRNLATDPERAVRRAAYHAELAAWQGVAVPLAAALNSIKGESNILNRRRGWGSALDVALYNNNIDRQTLDAMMSAARDSLPDFRRYFRAKARALGLGKLAWYDLFAPVGVSSRAWEFDSAVNFLLDQFGAYSPRLREFAERAFAERWIDAEPREGKEGGAFCMPLRREESRILSNFVPSYDGMSTLAHELGHGYHNFNLADRTIFQRQNPMTLAETASIFCETIVREAALERSGRADQRLILEASLQDQCQVVVDITSRFIFERNVFAARERRDLSVDELNRLMLEAQLETYGDGLDQGALHPYMWAVKGHYYSTGRPYYNFPYMFGLLFGLGLYARYRKDPESFKEGYDEMLSSTGMADAATIAGRFDIDIRTKDFWRSSLDVVRAEIDRFEELIVV